VAVAKLDRHDASRAVDGPAAFRLPARRDAEGAKRLFDRRRVEPAERHRLPITHGTEERRLNLQKGSATADLSLRLAAARDFADDVRGDPHSRPHAKPAWQRGDEAPARGRHRRDRPFRRQDTGAADDIVVAWAFRAQESEHGCQRGESNAAVVETLRVQPVFVEVQAARERLLNGLMETRRDQPADPCLCHDSVMRAHPVAAAILAGGQARRFGGQDKSRLVVDGRTIIVRQVEILQRITAEVFVVANARDRFADLGLPVHADLIPGAAAIGGVYTALETANADRVIVVACDLPFLDEGMLRRLVELAPAGDGAWVRTARGVEPLLACYRREARLTIRARIDEGRLKLADLEEALEMGELGAEELAQFGPAARLLANINTPDDYARIQ
jgi:molybdenum cofactor guanylyltransferase